MISVTIPARRGFTHIRAARELGISVAIVRALLKSGRLRTVEESSGRSIDPITVYDCIIETHLWNDMLSNHGNKTYLRMRLPLP